MTALCLASALLFTVTTGMVWAAIFFLVFGCFVHIVAKGTLIRDAVLCREGVCEESHGSIQGAFLRQDHP